MQSRREFIAGLASAGVFASGAGCSGLPSGSGESATTSGTVVVGSKTFAENRVLGYMAYEALNELTDLRVVDEIGYGATSTVWNGLTGDALDLYWEYTGTLRLTHPPQQDSLISDPEKQYQQASETVTSEYDLRVLNRAPFNNTYTIVTRPEWVRETGIDSLSGLAAHVNAGNTDVTIALGPSFYDRADGWPGLLDHYGFDEAAVEEWSDNVEVVSLGLTYEFLETGDADLAMGFLTDGQIGVQNFQPLADDQNFWPIYSPCPCVAASVVAENAAVKEALNPIGPSIGDESTMRELNAAVTIDGKSAQSVARSHLESNGLV